MLGAMPMATHPIFSVPAIDIDAALLRSFLELEMEESFSVDYKRDHQAAPETISAMANSYGGVVLIGVDAHARDKNLPGNVVGVDIMDKDKLVSKVTTTLDPPWWTPEIIPVALDGRLVLVVRIDPATAPVPVLYKGAVKVRLDGRNTTADRRVVQTLFATADEPAPVPVGEPRYAPDRQLSPAHRPNYRAHGSPPPLVVRAALSRPLGRDKSRLRLRGTVVDALARSLSRPDITDEWSPKQPLLELIWRADRGAVGPWVVDPGYGHGRFVRLSVGHGSLESPPKRGVRLECTAELAGGGSSLELIFDAHFWPGGERLSSTLLIHACHEAVSALVEDALPTIAQALLGKVVLPTPPIELHIAAIDPVNQVQRPLQELIDTDFLGERSGTGELRRGSEYLPDELVAAGQLRAAVNEALENIALDWRYFHPTLP